MLTPRGRLEIMLTRELSFLRRSMKGANSPRLRRDLKKQPSTWAQIKPLIGHQRKRVLALTSASILSATTEAVTLAVFAQVAAALIKTNGTHARLSLLHIDAPTKTLIIVAFVLAIIRLLLQVPLSVLPARIVAHTQASLRTNLFDAFTHASWEVQSRDREGKLQETVTSQVTQAGQGLMNMLNLLTSGCTFIVLLAFAIALNPLAAGIVLIVAFCMFAPLRPVRRLGKRRGRALSQAQIRYAAAVAESIRMAEETQVFGTDAAQRGRIDQAIATARKLFFQTQILLRLSSNLSQSVVYLLIVAGLAGLDAAGGSHAGSLGAVVLILVRASTSGQSLQNSYQNVVQSMPFVERVREAERRYRESAPTEGTRQLSRVSSLAFEGVGYAYRPGQPVLSDICFEVSGGEVVGIIGPSGAGKSTLVQLLLRLRPPAEGRYLVNGIPAQEITREDWHRRVAYVPQEPRLLHASVTDNIRYFRDIDQDAVERAARLARIHEDVMSWGDGYQTIVGPRADAISGGQQQRICLARALAARPEVLVLDEPTSALDPKSEMLIQESLTALKHELTLFIVAHRMSTLDICDRVMIIIEGKLAAFDTIGHLQRHNHYYRTASGLTTAETSSAELLPGAPRAVAHDADGGYGASGRSLAT
jgi:ABC-type multidrug transport system fused ATPase/permease subunit